MVKENAFVAFRSRLDEVDQNLKKIFLPFERVVGMLRMESWVYKNEYIPSLSTEELEDLRINHGVSSRKHRKFCISKNHPKPPRANAVRDLIVSLSPISKTIALQPVQDNYEYNFTSPSVSRGRRNNVVIEMNQAEHVFSHEDKLLIKEIVLIGGKAFDGDFRRWFSVLDSNGNGLLSVSEVVSGLATLGFRSLTEKEIFCLVKFLDSEGNGLISWHEFSKLSEVYELLIGEKDEAVHSSSLLVQGDIKSPSFPSFMTFNNSLSLIAPTAGQRLSRPISFYTIKNVLPLSIKNNAQPYNKRDRGGTVILMKDESDHIRTQLSLLKSFQQQMDKEQRKIDILSQKPSLKLNNLIKRIYLVNSSTFILRRKANERYLDGKKILVDCGKENFECFFQQAETEGLIPVYWKGKRNLSVYERRSLRKISSPTDFISNNQYLILRND